MSLTKADLEVKPNDVALIFRAVENNGWALETVAPDPKFLSDDDPVPDHWRIAMTIRELIIKDDEDFKDLVIRKMEEMEDSL